MDDVLVLFCHTMWGQGVDPRAAPGGFEFTTTGAGTPTRAW